MYEDYSKQSLPTKSYRELLGSAVCVFNSNNSFIIENILKNDNEGHYNWSQLIDYTSGSLAEPIKLTITNKANKKIASKFNEIVGMRNRIIHSFQITDRNNEQVLATKKKNGEQFIITEAYLYEFISENNDLSNLLHNLRGY